ncbi:hypothetical protein WMF30_09440 [Sorangium sp. So ce134]
MTAMAESRGPKSNEREAFGLAEKLCTGAIRRRVFKEAGEYRKLCELARTHAMVTQDSTRVMNRIRALNRLRGVAVNDSAAAPWRRAAPSPGTPNKPMKLAGFAGSLSSIVRPLTRRSARPPCLCCSEQPPDGLVGDASRLDVARG